MVSTSARQTKQECCHVAGSRTRKATPDFSHIRHIDMYIRQKHIYLCGRISVYICIRIYMCISVHICISICLCQCYVHTSYINICINTCTYTFTCIHAVIFIPACIHIYTHTHAYTHMCKIYRYLHPAHTHNILLHICVYVYLMRTHT